MFQDLRKDIGLGVVDIKRTEIEKPDDIARAIERAENVLGKGADVAKCAPRKKEMRARCEEYCYCKK